MSDERKSVEFFARGRRSVVDFVEPNLNILAHAQAIELEIGSRCGGHGKCGGDRVRVTSSVAGQHADLSPLTDAELRLLSPDDLKAGVRLACQCFPNSAGVALQVEVLAP